MIVASGDTVVTRGRWNAIVRTNGAKIDADMVHFFKLHDGKITSWKGYSDTAAVLAGHIGKAASMAR